jgi:hypothetical protein
MKGRDYHSEMLAMLIATVFPETTKEFFHPIVHVRLGFELGKMLSLPGLLEQVLTHIR